MSLLRIAGEIDISNAEEVSSAIAAAVPNRLRTVVVDLTGTTYLDSAGIRLLFQLADRLRTRRRELRLVVPGEAAVRAVLDYSGISDLIPLRSSVEEALD